MSEIKITVPAEARRRFIGIAEQMHRLNVGGDGGVLWLASDQGNSSYEWGQHTIGISKDKKLYVEYQGGCSCNGAEAPDAQSAKTYDLASTIVLTDDEDYYDSLRPAIEDAILTSKVVYNVLHDKRVTPKQVIEIKNAEIRRAIVEIVGYDKIVKTATTIDESEVDGKLLRIPLVDDEDITLLQVKDPSTAREYFLRVPPEMKTARQARAWTFGFEADDFNLEKET